MRINDRIGQRYGRLLVLERSPNKSKKDTNARWLCRCDCGMAIIAYGQDLGRGRTKSCGCLNAENRYQHGMAYEPVYAVWQAMLQRCTNPKSQSYANYGARGIYVCEEWKKFQNFFADMGCPPKDYSLDRINVNGSYTKENCRWAAIKTQNNNTRRNRVVEFNGMTHTLAEWSEILGIGWYSLRARLDYFGWSIEKAFTTPPKENIGKPYEFCGETKTLREWAAERGMPFDTLRKRIGRLGWSLEKALTEPCTPKPFRKGLN